jgi:hypothetical protein
MLLNLPRTPSHARCTAAQRGHVFR